MSDTPIQAVIDEQPVQAELITQPIFAKVVVGGSKGDKGDPGTAGGQGPQGPPGTGSATYVYNQIMPSTAWTIVHGMGNYPAVFTEDSAESEIKGDVAYPDTNTVVVTFSTPEGGKAFLN